MNKYEKVVYSIIMVSIVWLSSCASSYKLIEPQKLNYIPFKEDSDISISYNYNVLQDSKNNRYAKNESKSNIKIVAIELINNGSLPINFTNHVKIFSNNQRILPLEAEYAASLLKQPSNIYLLYSLGVGWSQSCNGNDCSTTIIPFGLPIGVGNLLLANSANKKFVDNMRKNDILTKTIYPGEKTYGLIALPISEIVTLRFEQTM